MSISIYCDSVGESKAINLWIRGWVFETYFIDYVVRQLWSDFSWNICEIGAGMGHKFQVLQKFFPKAHFLGIEPSEWMRKRALDDRWLHFREWTLQETRLPDASQDVVCLFQVWHHIPRIDYTKCIKEISRILKPGGRIILLDTFSPEPEDNVTKQAIFDVLYRAYAVLSQTPTPSFWKRFCKAIDSVLRPSGYRTWDYGHHTPIFSETRDILEKWLWLKMCSESQKLCYWFSSEMYIFEKN